MTSLSGNIASCTFFMARPRTPSYLTNAIYVIPNKTKLAMTSALIHENLDSPSSEEKISRIEAARLMKYPVKSSLWNNFRVNVIRMHEVGKVLVGVSESQVVSKCLDDDRVERA